MVKEIPYPARSLQIHTGRWEEIPKRNNRALPRRNLTSSSPPPPGSSIGPLPQQAAEQALRESEERFRRLTALSVDLYWEQDEHCRFTGFSEGHQSSNWRPNPAKVIGKCRWELEGTLPVGGSWDEHRADLAARKPFHDFEYMRVKEGEPPRYLVSSGEPVFDANGVFRGYQGVVRDVTESRNASGEARRLALQLATTLESITDAFLTLDRDWRCTYVNGQAELLLRRPRSQLLGSRLWEEFPEAVGSLLQQQCRRAMDGNITVQFEAYFEPIEVWLSLRLFPSAQGLAIYFRNVTQRVQAQQEILRLNAELEARVQQRTAQLEAANRELEAFAYSIAHDLRAPLGSIDGFSQMLEKSARDALPQAGLHYLKRIRAGVRQIGEITDGLLTLASLSRTSLQAGRVDMSSIAHDVLGDCRSEAPGRPAKCSVQEGMYALGDSRLLKLAIAALVANAWKFTQPMEAAEISVGCNAGPEGEALYFVRDNGVGFDPAYAGRMFQAFQRMHPADQFEGTGIGLAIAHKVVARHGGRIWAESAPGQGATFFFTLGAIIT